MKTINIKKEQTNNYRTDMYDGDTFNPNLYWFKVLIFNINQIIFIYKFWLSNSSEFIIKFLIQ